jgi:hypothetical protein
MQIAYAAPDQCPCGFHRYARDFARHRQHDPVTDRRQRIFERLCYNGHVPGRQILASLRHLWLDAPELEAFGIDRLFDRIARKIIGRSIIRPNRPYVMPGAELIRQLAAGRVSDKSPQTGMCI